MDIQNALKDISPTEIWLHNTESVIRGAAAIFRLTGNPGLEVRGFYGRELGLEDPAFYKDDIADMPERSRVLVLGNIRPLIMRERRKLGKIWIREDKIGVVESKRITLENWPEAVRNDPTAEVWQELAKHGHRIAGVICDNDKTGWENVRDEFGGYTNILAPEEALEHIGTYPTEKYGKKGWQPEYGSQYFEEPLIEGNAIPFPEWMRILLSNTSEDVQRILNWKHLSAEGRDLTSTVIHGAQYKLRELIEAIASGDNERIERFAKSGDLALRHRNAWRQKRDPLEHPYGEGPFFTGLSGDTWVDHSPLIPEWGGGKH